MLAAGAGNDVFQFLAGEAGHDVISDFQSGLDHVDLFGVGKTFDVFAHITDTDAGAVLSTTARLASSPACMKLRSMPATFTSSHHREKRTTAS